MKKSKRKVKTTGDAVCKAARLSVFAKTLIDSLPNLADPVETAASLRSMTRRSTPPEHRRQLLAGRIALLARQGKIEVCAPEPVLAAPEPEPVVVAPPPPPPPAPKKPAQTTILSLDDAAALFSAFSMSDPDDAAPATASQISAPEAGGSSAPELIAPDSREGHFTMDDLAGETRDWTPGTTLDPEPETAAKPREEMPPPRKKKSKRAALQEPAPEQDSPVKEPEPEADAKPATAAPPPPEALRAKRVGESRIISADGSGGKPKIDFSALAAFGDDDTPAPAPPSPKAPPKFDLSALSAFDAPEEPEPAAEAGFTPGLKVDLAASGFFDDLADLSDDPEDPPPPKP